MLLSVSFSQVRTKRTHFVLTSCSLAKCEQVRTFLHAVLTFSRSQCSHFLLKLLIEPLYSENTSENRRSHLFSLMRCSHFDEVKQW